MMARTNGVHGTAVHDGDTDRPNDAETSRPSRQTLNDELFRRPPVPIGESALVIHSAYLEEPARAARSIARLRDRIDTRPCEPVSEDGDYILIKADDDLLKWECHTEFSNYTLVTNASGSDPFACEPDSIFPTDWQTEMEDQKICAVKLRVVPEDDETTRTSATSAFRHDVVSSLVADGQARIWADCNIGEDGCTRIVVEDRGMTAYRRARLVQRLIEIETYRMLAMLAFPPARTAMVELHTIESAMRRMVDRVAEPDSSQDQASNESTLQELLTLASRIERLSAVNAYRFDASRAYYDIVQQRLEDLREERLGLAQRRMEDMREHRVHDHQRLANFLRRRLGPAMQTVSAVSHRMEVLSGHIDYTASLIRTHVDLGMQRQNRSLLHSMDRRAALHLQLQQTLEWLTFAAMSYYGIGVIAYLAKAAEVAGAPIHPTVVTGAAAPVIIAAAYWVVRRIRRLVSEAEAA